MELRKISPDILYSDKLVEITGDSITFRWYYFPFGSKKVYFSDIEYIAEYKLTFLTGKWRIWGTGDFITWYPCDWKRPCRDKIFLIRFLNRWKRIGFTVEDSAKVAHILKEKVF